MCKVALVFACFVGAQRSLGYSIWIDSSPECLSAVEGGQGCDQQTSTPPKALATLLLRHVRLAVPSKLRQRRVAPNALAKATMGHDWEIDFYSRPVQGPDGKKLWELLVIDSTSSFRHVEPVPSNLVNSRELRKRIARIMDESAERPTRIRYFRSQMKNMINIALQELDVEVQPSRTTYALYDWLEERERVDYPAMPGYKATKRRPQDSMSSLMPDKMPEFLLGEKFEFLSLPIVEFLPGGGVDETNIGTGTLCPLTPEAKKAPLDAMVPGLVMFSTRANAIAAAMDRRDLAAISVNLAAREIAMETGLDTSWLFAKLNSPDLLQGAENHEAMRRQLGGLHFFSINDPNEDEPCGFWLLRGDI